MHLQEFPGHREPVGIHFAINTLLGLDILKANVTNLKGKNPSKIWRTDRETKNGRKTNSFDSTTIIKNLHNLTELYPSLMRLAQPVHDTTTK